MATVKKYYPIANRKDFFKYAVMENGKIAKTMKGEELIFMDREYAQDVASARTRVAARLKKDAAIKAPKKK